MRASCGSAWCSTFSLTTTMTILEIMVSRGMARGRRLQECCLMQQFAFGELLKAKHFHVVYDVGFTLQNQIRDDLSSGGRMHHSVSAEAVGGEEAGNLRYRTKNAVMIRSHLI